MDPMNEYFVSLLKVCGPKRGIRTLRTQSIRLGGDRVQSIGLGGVFPNITAVISG